MLGVNLRGSFSLCSSFCELGLDGEDRCENGAGSYSPVFKSGTETLRGAALFAFQPSKWFGEVRGMKSLED